MSYTVAFATVAQSLLSAFPKSELVRKLVPLLGVGAMTVDYVFARQAERLRQARYDQNIYLKQAELYRKEAERLKTESKYLREEGASPDTDCFSCATAHLAGMEGALRRAAKEAEKEGGCGPNCQRWVHIAAQEPAALFARDWTPEKKQKLPPEQKALLDRYAPRVEETMRKIAPTPEGEGVLRAAALLKESIRFAEAGDDIRHPEVEWRRLNAEAELSAAERLRPGTLPPEVSQNLRRLRQQVGSGITSTQTLVEAARKAEELSLKANAPAWERLDPSELERLADEVHAIRAGFASERRQLAHLVSEPIGPERHHAIPQEIIEQFTQPGLPAPGFREPTAKAFDNIVNALESRGHRVRIRSLPTTMEYSIEGLYDRKSNNILLDSSKVTKDSYSLQSLSHEGIHALLHNEPCWPKVSKKPYHEMTEEIQAHVGSLAFMSEMGLPIETRFGEEVKDLQIKWDEVEKKLGKEQTDDLRWAIRWLKTAAEGNDEILSEPCPAIRRRKVG
jgi:hypothetical protein